METIYDVFIKKGLSRRDFLKFSGSLAAILSLPSAMLPKVVQALETKPKPVVIWLELQDCAGCTESFIKSTNILPTDVLLDLISLEYHETLMAPSGEDAEESKREAMEKYKERYILVVEGSVTSAEDGIYCMVGGKSNHSLLVEAAENSAVILAVGSCASWGGIPAAKPNPTGARSVGKALPEHLKDKIINIPGCPPIADVMIAVIAQYLIEGKIPELDDLRRPVSFYGQTIHDRCYRRTFYDSGRFASSFDSSSAKEGHCLYKLGCKGPTTRNACATMRWNGGLSFPIQSGHPCFGCSEPDFWDRGHIYKPLSTTTAEIDAKEIGIAVAAGAVVGAAAGIAVKLVSGKSRQEKTND